MGPCATPPAPIDFLSLLGLHRFRRTPLPGGTRGWARRRGGPRERARARAKAKARAGAGAAGGPRLRRPPPPWACRGGRFRDAAARGGAASEAAAVRWGPRPSPPASGGEQGPGGGLRGWPEGIRRRSRALLTPPPPPALPESGSKLGAAEVLSAHPEPRPPAAEFLPSLEASVELLPSLDLRGHLLRPLFSKGGNGGPERLGDLSRVAQHRGLRTPRDPLFPDRAVPISNADLARLGKSGQRPCSFPRRGSPPVVSAASSLGPQEAGGFLGWAGASWRVA